jgi:hypothetical protein
VAMLVLGVPPGSAFVGMLVGVLGVIPSQLVEVWRVPLAGPRMPLPTWSIKRICGANSEAAYWAGWCPGS